MGKVIDTILDAAGIAWDVADIVLTPTNPWNWGALAADIGCLFLPFATGGGRAIKAVEGTRKIAKAAQAARLAGKADDFVDAIKNGERIFGKYKDMQKVTKGFNHAIEAHHLVPQALADLFTKNVDDYASVVLDKATHSGYTTEWNKVLDVIRNAEDPKAEILRQAERIYADAPDLLAVTKEFLRGL